MVTPLFFTARTGSLEPSELDIFKKQAECLQFLPEYHFGSTRKTAFPALSSTNTRNRPHSELCFFICIISDLCPDERESSAVKNTENDQTETEEEREDTAQ